MKNNITLNQATSMNPNGLKVIVGETSSKRFLYRPTSDVIDHIHSNINDVAGVVFNPINKCDFIEKGEIKPSEREYTNEEVEYMGESLRITAKTVEYVAKHLAEIEGIEYSPKLRERVWEEFRKQHR